MTEFIFENDWTWGLLQVLCWGFFAAMPIAIGAAFLLPGLRAPVHGLIASLADAVDGTNTAIGRVVIWAALFMVLVQFAVVLMRYVFGVNVIALQEFILYLHGILFMVGAGYTLLKDGHVRVDLIYREAGPRYQATINALGVYLLLLPAMALLFYVAWPYAGRSWEVLEFSRESSGLPVYPLKTLLLIFPTLVLMQSWSLAARSLLTLSGAEPREARS